MKNESPLIRALTEYYDGKKILSTNFDCKHLAECQGCLRPTPASAKTPKEAENTFTQAKAAFVGDRYCECAPRLLFVSLDPGGALKSGDSEYNHILPESRTLSGVWEGNARIMRRFATNSASLRRPRLEGTNQVAAAILGAFPDILQGEHAMRFYAHINAAKCTTNKKGREQTDKVLFDNCREYLRGEIDVLCPDIIVTHGGKARRGVKHAFRGAKIEKGKHPNLFVIHTQRPIFWLNTYHPSARKKVFDKQMRGENNGPREKGCGPGLNVYTQLIHGFISSRDS